MGSILGVRKLNQTFNQRESKILLAIDFGGTFFTFLLAYLEIIYLYWKSGSFRILQTVVFAVSCVSCFIFMTSICAVGYIRFMHKRYVSETSDRSETSSSRVISPEDSGAYPY